MDEDGYGSNGEVYNDAVKSVKFVLGGRFHHSTICNTLINQSIQH